MLGVSIDVFASWCRSGFSTQWSWREWGKLTFVMEQLLSHIFLGLIRRYFFLFKLQYSLCCSAVPIRYWWFLFSLFSTSRIKCLCLCTVFRTQCRCSNLAVIWFSILQNTMSMFSWEYKIKLILWLLLEYCFLQQTTSSYKGGHLM